MEFQVKREKVRGNEGEFEAQKVWFQGTLEEKEGDRGQMEKNMWEEENKKN